MQYYLFLPSSFARYDFLLAYYISVIFRATFSTIHSREDPSSKLSFILPYHGNNDVMIEDVSISHDGKIIAICDKKHTDNESWASRRDEEGTYISNKFNRQLGISPSFYK
jgi:hypothetical protein